MTKITAEQFKEMYIDEDNEVTLPRTSCVESGDEIVGYKQVFQTFVYKVGEQFFAITNSWPNSGVWSDSEQYDSEIYEVFPKIITKVIYATK